MQAGFLVAPQAPVATQPRQMIQPLPTGTERTPVAVPQFDVALANAIMDEARRIRQRLRRRNPLRARKASRLPCLIHDRERIANAWFAAAVSHRSGAEPPAPTVNSQGSLRQSPAERIRAVSGPRRTRARPPSRRLLVIWADGPAPDRRRVRDDASEHCRRCRETGRRRPPIAGGQTAPGHWRCTRTLRPRQRTLPIVSVRRPVRRAMRCFLCRNPSRTMPRESPQRRQTAPRRRITAAMRLPIAAAAPPAVAMTTLSRELSPPPREPSARTAPSTRHGSLPNEQTEPAVPLQPRRDRPRPNRSPCRRCKACRGRHCPSIATGRH